MYRRIAEILPQGVSGKILSIGQLGEIGFVVNKTRSEIIETHYPDIDMQNLPYPDETFDAIISDQVLEHVENPIKAADESYRVIKGGGIVIHTTCFINQFHPSPGDFWRFSPDALRFLCKSFSEIIQCEGWGNWAAVMACFLGDRFRNMRVPKQASSLRGRLATKNDPRYPIVTWIIAKK
ncbi:MAG: methyltransferase domain-containing protein [bacterium]|nr:methyltransferase domain-containing protein [bacterium]